MKSYIRDDIDMFQGYSASENIVQLSSKVGIPHKQAIKANTGENPIHELKLPKNLNIDFFRYPDPLCQELRKKVAGYVNYSVENIMCTSGSDEALDLIVRLFVDPKEEVIICPPTYPYFEFYANLARAKVISVTRNEDFSLNLEKILSIINPNTKMILLDSPGNPCGTTISTDDLKKLLKKEIIVVVDEAYYEYSKETVIDLIRAYPNLVVTRTFSKWAGLAGLRVGYVVASEKVINSLLNIKLPYNVNSVGQYLASYVIDNKEDFLKRLEKHIALRDTAIKKMKNFNEVSVLPSKSVYVILKLKNTGDSKELIELLEKNGIFVKPIEQPLLEHSLRINFGTKLEIDRFCSVFQKWIEKRQTIKTKN